MRTFQGQKETMAISGCRRALQGVYCGMFLSLKTFQRSARWLSAQLEPVHSAGSGEREGRGEKPSRSLCSCVTSPHS
jgi:hypothetical protein